MTVAAVWHETYDRPMNVSQIAEWGGNLAYALIFLSFLARNMLQLRLLSICGSVAGLFFAYFNSAGILWTPFAWNILFIAVNCWHTISLIWQRRKQELNDEEKFLLAHAFKAFPLTELKSLIRLAKRRAYTAGEALIHRGDLMNQLFVIASGIVSIELEKKEIAKLTPGSFLGEMSFLSHEGARADAVGFGGGELLAWSHAEIQGWTSEDPARGGLLQAALGSQIIDLLMRKSV